MHVIRDLTTGIVVTDPDPAKLEELLEANVCMMNTYKRLYWNHGYLF